MNWCLYESIGHNENVMAIDVVKEYEWYELQKSKGPSLLQRLCSAADHGHPNAQAEVGRYHLQALNGMPKDLTRAYVWYSLAAGSGCFTFSYELDEIKQGLTLEQISQAEEQLKNWKPGLCEHELIFDATGYRYRVTPSYTYKRMISDEREAEWKLSKVVGTYCPNADLGHADAQKHIGDLYYFGTDEINIDLIRAHVWCSLAAKSGNKEASELLDYLVKELSPDQLREARTQLEEWEPGQCERDLMEAIPEEN